jgi:hypothetical protein
MVGMKDGLTYDSLRTVYHFCPSSSTTFHIWPVLSFKTWCSFISHDVIQIMQESSVVAMESCAENTKTSNRSSVREEIT